MAAKGAAVGSPLDGEVFMAGRNRWTPFPPREPKHPARCLLTFTVDGQAVYARHATELTARSGDLVLACRPSPITWTVPRGETWEYHYVRFEPYGDWHPPPIFEPIAPGLYRAHVSLTSTRQRIRDGFVRVATDTRLRETSTALAPLMTAAPDRTASQDDVRRRLMMTVLNEILLLAARDPYDVARLDPRIAEALELMATEILHPPTVDSLAGRVHLSPSRFAHLFTEQVGLSPIRVLRLIQLRQAASWLQYGDEPIGAIAQRSGFSSSVDFSRQFRRRYGVSPRQFRAGLR